MCLRRFIYPGRKVFEKWFYFETLDAENNKCYPSALTHDTAGGSAWAADGRETRAVVSRTWNKHDVVLLHSFRDHLANPPERGEKGLVKLHDGKHHNPPATSFYTYPEFGQWVASP